MSDNTPAWLGTVATLVVILCVVAYQWWQEYERGRAHHCPVCIAPECPPEKVCPACVPTTCPACPPEKVCPACVPTTCPACPPEKVCPDCPVCVPTTCPDCPPEKVCPACVPTTCPACPPEKVCPACVPTTCPACPPEKVCPEPVACPICPTASQPSPSVPPSSLTATEMSPPVMAEYDVPGGVQVRYVEFQTGVETAPTATVVFGDNTSQEFANTARIDLGTIRMVQVVRMRQSATVATTGAKQAMAGEKGTVVMYVDPSRVRTLPVERFNGSRRVDLRYAPDYAPLVWEGRDPNLAEISPGLLAWVPNLRTTQSAYALIQGRRATTGLEVTALEVTATLDNYGKPWSPYGRTFVFTGVLPVPSVRGIIASILNETTNGLAAWAYDRNGQLYVVTEVGEQPVQGVPPLPLGTAVAVAVAWYRPPSGEVMHELIHPNGRHYRFYVPLPNVLDATRLIALCPDVDPLAAIQPTTSLSILVREWRVYPMLKLVSELSSIWDNVSKG